MAGDYAGVTVAAAHSPKDALSHGGSGMDAQSQVY